MSDTERAARLVDQVRKALEKSREKSPVERFREMVDAGLINPDGTLRRDASPSPSAAELAASKG